MSLVKLSVRDVDEVLPQPSVAVHVLVTERVHPVPCSLPSVKIAVNPVLQLSVTDTMPNAVFICAELGLHGTDPAEVNEITGAVTSLVKVTVCVAEPVLPQASVAVHVFITERIHPVPCSAPTVPVAVNPALQLSVTVATVPKAFVISLAVGLQGTGVAGLSVITGFVLSLAVKVCVHVLAHPAFVTVNRMV